MFVALTVDQRQSRHLPDRVEGMLEHLNDLPVVRPFERTAGEEFQGLLADSTAVVDAVLGLVRDARWSIGVGIGPVERPLPSTTRAVRGLAFIRARNAVEAAKRAPQHLAVRGDDTGVADDVEAGFALLAAVLGNRTAQGWEAVDLAATGLPQAAVAAELGVTRQAIGQRLAVAHWREEQQARRSLQRLLDRAATGVRPPCPIGITPTA